MSIMVSIAQTVVNWENFAAKQDQNWLKAFIVNMNDRNSQQPSTLGCTVWVITSGRGCMLAVAERLGGCYVQVIGRVNTPKRCSPISRCAKDTFYNDFWTHGAWCAVYTNTNYFYINLT